jgi:hypothetical protein
MKWELTVYRGSMDLSCEEKPNSLYEKGQIYPSFLSLILYERASDHLRCYYQYFTDSIPSRDTEITFYAKNK